MNEINGELDYDRKKMLDKYNEMIIFKNVKNNIGFPHVFKIEDDLVCLFKETKFNNSISHLPFNYIKLDLLSFFTEGNTKGIIISPLHIYEKENGFCLNFAMIHTIHEENTTFHVDLNKDLSLKKDKIDLLVENEMNKTFEKRIVSEALDINKKIQLELINIIGNFLNYLDSRDIQIEHIDRTKSNPNYIEKKLKKGKIPIPYIHNVILIGKTRKVYDELMKEKGKQKFSHAFWVRGHWRHLESIKYKDKRYKNIWILPHIKGIGKPKNKTYEVAL